jgi:surface antigen
VGPANAVAAGLAGAAVGGLLGNRIGSAMDDDDKQRAYAAQMQALESGKSGTAVAWKNPDSGRYGSVVPGPPTRPTDSSAGNTPTRSISTASRRSRAATPVATRTARGLRWADHTNELTRRDADAGGDPS